MQELIETQPFLNIEPPLQDLLCPVGLQKLPRETCSSEVRLFVMWLWYTAGFCHRWFAFNPADAWRIGACDQRTGERWFDEAYALGLIDREKMQPNYWRVRTTQKILENSATSGGQLVLDFMRTPSAFGGNPAIGTLIAPFGLLSAPCRDISAAHKFVGWYLLAQTNFDTALVSVCFKRVAEDLARHRNQIRKSITFLNREANAMVQIEPRKGGGIYGWQPGVLLPGQLDSLRMISESDPAGATQFVKLLQLIAADGTCLAHGTLTSASERTPPAQATFTSQPQERTSPEHGTLTSASDRTPPAQAAFTSQPQERTSPEHDTLTSASERTPPAQAALTSSLARGLQNINHSQSLNESLEIVGNGESEIAERLKESCRRLIKKVQLRGAYRWYVLLIVMLFETDELQINGKAVPLSEGDLATLIESCAGKNGKYFTGALKRRLAELLSPGTDFRKLSDLEQRSLADSVALPKLSDVRAAAKRIGYAWNEEHLRGKVQGSPEKRDRREGLE